MVMSLYFFFDEEVVDGDRFDAGQKGYQMSKRDRNKSDDIYRELIKIPYVSPL